MVCPFCGTQMIAGYLNSGAAIWSERRHKISLLPDGKERYALRLDTPMFSPHHIESFCCPKCRKILIDASEYEHDLEK